MVCSSPVPPRRNNAATGLSSLAPGAEVRISATFGAGEFGCTTTDDLVVVQATTAGGAQEDYIAFADRVVEVGDCGAPDFCVYFAPGDQGATEAPCDQPVCWSQAPGSDFYQPAYDCGAEYCWYAPPGEGTDVLRPCAEEICWISFSGEEGDFLYDVPCNFEFCEYSAPDGSVSFTSPCGERYCWTSPPEGGTWQSVYGCGEFEDLCWVTPPDGGTSFLWYGCSEPVCFPVAPDGLLDFGQGQYPTPCEPEVDLCWPAPADGGTFYSYPVGCEEVPYYCVATPPDGGPSFVLWCDYEYCWVPAGELGLSTDFDIPPDLLVPSECAEGQQGQTGGPPASSIPVETVQGVSTPAVLVEGSSEPVDLLPSASITPAELVPSSRVEPIPGGGQGGGGDDTEVPPATGGPKDDEPDRIEDVLDLTKPGGTDVNIAGFPDSVQDIGNLRAAADAALYRAKQAGRNRVEKASAGD